VLLVLLLVGAGGFWLVRSIDLDNPLSGAAAPEDFPGPGAGSVTFTVRSGDSLGVMGRGLEELGVVASAQAYVDAAGADPGAGGIREGVYRLREEMAAADVVELLRSGDTRGGSFTFTAGKTVDEVVDLLARDTDVRRRELEAALARPDAIGLPADAAGDVEGYLAPGTYTFFPDDDARSILSAMVARSVEGFAEVDLAGAGERLGYTQQELLTVASLIEAEGSVLGLRDKARIARVIYNRLEVEEGNPSAGFLGLDATIDFIYGDKVARRTFAEIDAVADNPYNTYRQAGLPPGPIATPGTEALEAAIEPADGPWFYYATVNLRTAETKFAVTPEEAQQLVDELDAYCDTQSDRC
jgi:UPF0755 protein